MSAFVSDMPLQDIDDWNTSRELFLGVIFWMFGNVPHEGHARRSTRVPGLELYMETSNYTLVGTSETSAVFHWLTIISSQYVAAALPLTQHGRR